MFNGYLLLHCRLIVNIMMYLPSNSYYDRVVENDIILNEKENFGLGGYNEGRKN